VRTHEARLLTGLSGTHQSWPWLDTAPTWSPELGRLTGSSPTQTTREARALLLVAIVG